MSVSVSVCVCANTKPTNSKTPTNWNKRKKRRKIRLHYEEKKEINERYFKRQIDTLWRLLNCNGFCRQTICRLKRTIFFQFLDSDFIFRAVQPRDAFIKWVSFLFIFICEMCRQKVISFFVFKFLSSFAIDNVCWSNWNCLHTVPFVASFCRQVNKWHYKNRANTQ